MAEFVVVRWPQASIVFTGSFSLSMLGQANPGVEHRLSVREYSLPVLLAWLQEMKANGERFVASAIGHQDTARLMSDILGINLPCNRESVELMNGRYIVVAQHSGPRLPEGTTELPPGASFRWFRVEAKGGREFNLPSGWAYDDGQAE